MLKYNCSALVKSLPGGVDLLKDEIILIGECIRELQKMKSGSRDDVVRTIELAKRYG